MSDPRNILDLSGKYVLMMEEDLAKYDNQWPILSISDNNDQYLTSCQSLKFLVASKDEYDAVQITNAGAPVIINCPPDIQGARGHVFQMHKRR